VIKSKNEENEVLLKGKGITEIEKMTAPEY
jgi:hypothetical protein